MAAHASPGLTTDKLKKLDAFLVTWDAHEGWPTSSPPLTSEERIVVYEQLWLETEVTWLRVLGSVLNPQSERQFVEVTVVNHFNVFPQDVERMFGGWPTLSPGLTLTEVAPSSRSVRGWARYT
jgi:hypothetical protein